MITKYAIAAVVFGAAAYLSLRKKPKLSCGPGSTFVPMTIDEAQVRWGNYAAWPQIQAQIRKYGGTCTKSGVVTDAGNKPVSDSIADSAGGVIDDAEDSVLITHPYQLM